MTANRPGPYDPQDEEEPELPEASERSRSVALVLGLLGGVFGLHRFYVGRVQSGVAMVITFGGLGIWWLYDMVTLVAGEFRDADDLPVRNWQVTETVGAAGGSHRRDRCSSSRSSWSRCSVSWVSLPSASISPSDC
jgi:TM2 domain-containing membrane protein YozV